MSLAINPDRVTRVLIGNRWHEVLVTDMFDPTPCTSTFRLDAYEFVSGDGAILLGGQDRLGFVFRTPEGRRVCGPLTALQAVEVGTW